jgi:hypothetical protein
LPGLLVFFPATVAPRTRTRWTAAEIARHRPHRQLAGLGAILAIPRAPGNEQTYSVVRNLNVRPVRGSIEDIKKIELIFWVDDKRESITPLCAALGIRPVPHHVAFFPKELEEKLVKLKLANKGLPEDQM